MPSKKRGDCQGFDGIKGENTAKRIKLWTKNEVECKWRRVQIEKIRFTHVRKTFRYGEISFTQTYISAFGAKESVKKRKMNTRGKTSKKSLPDGVVDALGIPDNFDPKDLTIDVDDDGDLGYREFYILLCQKCHMSEKGFMNYFLNKYKSFLPSNPSMADLMDNWDKIVSKHPEQMKHLDVLGCILPDQPDIIASPNERKCISRPIEHSTSKCHKWTLLSDPEPTRQTNPVIIDDDITTNQEQASNSSSSSMTSPLTSPSASTSGKKRQSTLLSPTSTKKQKMLTVALDGTVTAEKTVKVKNTKTGNNTTVTVKHGKRLTFKPVNQLLDPSVSVFKEPADSMEREAQNSCYSFVLSGCSKEVSNNTSIEFYEKHIDHLRKHHQESVGHLEFDSKILPKPLRAQLDRNNIKHVHAALVESYKHLTSSAVNPTLYQPFIGDAHFCVFTDGIQKFGKELNGSYARTADKDLNVTNAPVSLHSIKGGSMNGQKLAVDLMNVINEIKPIPKEKSAFANFVKDPALGDRPEGPVSPPEYFKCCTFINKDDENKKLDLLFEHWPVCITADGCATNGAAVNLLVDKIGLLCPDTRCSGHAGHGSVRRLATSKTMSVQEVVDYAINIKPVLKHFKNSGKSLSLLNDTLKLLEMKQMKAMMWCPTRMGYLLTSSKRCTKLLVPLADVLVTCDIKKENAAYFLSPKCFGIMHVFADVEEVFMKGFIRRLDGDKSVIIDVFNESANAISALDGLEVKSFNSFIEGISEDENGNIILSTTTTTAAGETESHDITLNYTHNAGRRGAAETKVEN